MFKKNTYSGGGGEKLGQMIPLVTKKCLQRKILITKIDTYVEGKNPAGPILCLTECSDIYVIMTQI
jgi:hypothetical protein